MFEMGGGPLESEQQLAAYSSANFFISANMEGRCP